jgi:hypothetical protein
MFDGDMPTKKNIGNYLKSIFVQMGQSQKIANFGD